MTPAEVAEISAYAKEFNQRLGQYIDNALHTGGHPITDLFMMENEELLRCCRNYYMIYKGDV